MTCPSPDSDAESFRDFRDRDKKANPQNDPKMELSNHNNILIFVQVAYLQSLSFFTFFIF
jgi:hypothetical protein